MSLVQKIEDHADRGARLLVTQFRESPLLDAMTRAFLDRLQDMEDVVDDVRLLRWLDTASGVQLDTIGRHVDEPRAGKTTSPTHLVSATLRGNFASGGAFRVTAIGAPFSDSNPFNPSLEDADKLALVVAATQTEPSTFPFLFESLTPSGGFDWEVRVTTRATAPLTTPARFELELINVVNDAEIVATTLGVDDDYRNALRLRIFINASKGEPETVREIFRRLTGSAVTQLWENAPAALQLYGNGSIHPAGLAATMTSVAPAAAGIVPVALSFGTVPFIVSDNFEYARLAVTEDGTVIDLLEVDTEDTGEQHEVLLNPGVSVADDRGLGFAEVDDLGVVDGTGAGRLVEVFQLAAT